MCYGLWFARGVDKSVGKLWFLELYYHSLCSDHVLYVPASEEEAEHVQRYQQGGTEGQGYQIRLAGGCLCEYHFHIVCHRV